MSPELHPTLYQLVPSVTYVIVRKFKGWVDTEDIRQELYMLVERRLARLDTR